MELFDEFFKDKPTLQLSIEALCAKHSLNLLRDLKKEKERANFLSLITELQYGMFFDKLGALIRYEQKITPGSRLTPDWTLRLNGQAIIAEVGRLNPSEDEQQSSNIAEALAGALKEIRQSYYVQVSYKDDSVNLSNFDLDGFKNSAEQWLGSDRALNDQTTIAGVVKLTVIHKDTGCEHVCFMGDYNDINEKPLRLKSNNGLLVSKISKYGPVAETNNLPLLVCLSMHAETWFDAEDVSIFLYGPQAEFGDEEAYNEYYPGAVFHQIGDGFFFANENGFVA